MHKIDPPDVTALSPTGYDVYKLTGEHVQGFLGPAEEYYEFVETATEGWWQIEKPLSSLHAKLEKTIFGETPIPQGYTDFESLIDLVGGKNA